MAKINLLYFNGLGTGATRKREQLAFRYLAKQDIEVTHAHVDWRSGETFDDLLVRMVKLTRQELKKHGKLILVGSSAGGSLALNVLGEVQSRNLSAITLCSRLRFAKLPKWDRRTLKRMAHIGTLQASQAFFDSVTYCSKRTIPKLTANDKERTLIVQQWADFVVPRPTMSVEGLRTYKVAGLGHGWGIAAGVKELPEIIKVVNRRSEMARKYPHLVSLPYSYTHIAVPISGLMTGINDQQKAIAQALPESARGKSPIKERYKAASQRISTCVGYFITIHNRLFDENSPKLFLDKNLDWESLRIYTKVALDSLAMLVPFVYGASPSYRKDGKKRELDAFNNLDDWFTAKSIDDDFKKRCDQIKSSSGWYNIVNDERNGFIHNLATPNIIRKQTVGGHTIEQDLIMRISSEPLKPAEITATEDEVKLLLRNLFDFLVFSDDFFAEKLRAQGWSTHESRLSMYNLVFDGMKPFIVTLFDEEG